MEDSIDECANLRGARVRWRGRDGVEGRRECLLVGDALRWWCTKSRGPGG